MKTTGCIITFFLLIIQSGFSQEPEPPETNERVSKNYLYLSPINLALHQLMFGYERDFNSKHGILFLPSVISNKETSEYVTFGATAEAQYRYRIIAKKNPRGKTKNPYRQDVYIGPFVQYQYIEEDYYNRNFNAISAGWVFGLRFSFFERLSIDAYFGVGGKKSYGDDDGVNSVYLANYTGIIAKGNLQIGMAF